MSALLRYFGQVRLLLSAFSLAPPLRSTSSAAVKAALFAPLRAHSSSRQDAAHRVWPIRNCESACSGSRQAGVVRFPRVHAFLCDPSERLGLRAREETGGQANACQASRDQGAANGHTARRDRKAGPLALPGSARLDGLLCCADERLSDLSIPASHDRTLARRADASKRKTSTNVDENEEDR